MAGEATAALELPIGVTESKVLQQLARIESQVRKTSNNAASNFVKSNAKIAQSFRPISSEAQGMSRSTVASLQNVSYQIQDIFVQIQGGQGIFRAFSQQMPQLLSGFGAGGAIAGLATAVGASLIPALFGAKNEAADFGKEIERLNSLLKVHQEMTDISAQNMGELQKEYGANAILMRQLADAMADLAKLEFLQNFETQKNGVTTSLEDIRLLIKGMDEAMSVGAGGATYREQTLEALRTVYSLTEEQARRVVAAMDEIDAAQGPADAAQAALDLSNALSQARDEGASLPADMLAAAKQAAELAQVAIRAATALGDTASAADALAATNPTPPITTAANEAARLAENFRQALGYAQQMGGFSPDLNRFGTPNSLQPGYMSSSLRPQPAPSGIGGVDWGAAPKSGGGGKRQTDADKEYNKLLRDREGLLNKLETPAEKYAEQLKLIETLSTTKDKKTGDFLISEEEASAARQRLESLQPAAQAVRSALQSAFDGVFDDPKEALKDLAKQLAQMALNMQLMKYFPSIFGSSGIIPLSANAKGGVYSGSGISSYSGQVVSKPTVFPFAKGAGLMGEAGPEAILPLTRVNGRLGVRASGGGSGSDIRVIDQRGANAPAIETQTQRGPSGREMVTMVVKEEMTRGRFDGSMKGRYGTSPQKRVR